MIILKGTLQRAQLKEHIDPEKLQEEVGPDVALGFRWSDGFAEIEAVTYECASEGRTEAEIENIIKAHSVSANKDHKQIRNKREQDFVKMKRVLENLPEIVADFENRIKALERKGA